MLAFKPISLGQGGVCHCVRCTSRAKSPAGLDRIAADILSLRSSISPSSSSGPPRGVRLGGFEPFAHPNLVQVIGMCAQAGINRVMVCTDGGALANPMNARGCIESGARLFEIPFLGPSAELHDRLSGSPGSFDRALAGLRTVRDVSAQTGLRVACIGLIRACPHTAPMLATTVASLANSGLVRSIRIAAEPGTVIDAVTVVTCVDEATAAGVAIFGDSFGSHLEGAAPYQLMTAADREDQGSSGTGGAHG